MTVVLITRPEPGATQTAARVAALGLTPVVAPLLSIQPVGRSRELPDGVAATLLTSRNAVAGCPPSCHDRPVLAVGNATAASAVNAGFRQVKTASGDAAALAELVAQTLAPEQGSLFLPVGRYQGANLAQALRRKGFRVLRRVVYEACGVSALPVDAEAHLRRRQVGVALFFSADTARHFVRLVRQAGLGESVHDVDAVSISERSTVALRLLDWRRICVAAKPNQDAMLALLT